ncbi:hypothetical protein AHF37_10518 [Paragonimus kellicotti]|nr:hypothetical protein AHF37_10518 [Paragonimus kellicotti]
MGDLFSWTSVWTPSQHTQNPEPRCGELPSPSFKEFDTRQPSQSDHSSLRENVSPKQSFDWVSFTLGKMDEASLNSAAYEDNAQLRLIPSRPSALSLTFPLNAREDNQNQ